MGITFEEMVERKAREADWWRAITEVNLDEYMTGPDWDWVTAEMVEANEGLDREKIRAADLAVRQVMLNPETTGGTSSDTWAYVMHANPGFDERAVGLAVNRFRWQIEMVYADYDDVRRFLTDFPTSTDRSALWLETHFGTSDPEVLFGERCAFSRRLRDEERQRQESVQ